MTNITLSEEDTRRVAKWAGRKLSDHRLRELAKAHDNRDVVTFDRITEELFASKCCAEDWRLHELLQGSDEERLTQLRDALWRHVAPAIGDYTDRSCKQRVELYLIDLEQLSLQGDVADEASTFELEEAAA